MDAGPYEVELVAGSSTSPWDCAAQDDVGLSCTPKVLGVASIGASGNVLWTPSDHYNTVTRIDAEERTATARYQVAEAGEGIHGLSTNLEGDVVVATHEGTLTRVAVGDCPAGDTSTSVDDVLPYGSDSCVLWSERIVGAGDRLLHVAWELRSVLDAREYFVWVLEPSERRVIEVDAEGAVTAREVSVDPSLPRGLAVDTEGHLWVGSVDFQPRAIEIDPVEGEVLRRILVGGQPTVGCVTVDREGGVWFANGNLMRIDQDTEAYDTVGVYSASGLAEREGSLIAAVGRIAFVDLETLDIEWHDPADGDVVTVAVDSLDQVWAMPWGSAPLVLDGSDWIEADVPAEEGGVCGDLTGAQLAAVQRPEGKYSHVFEACDPGTLAAWRSLRYAADTPDGSSISFFVRASESRAGLAAASAIDVGTAPETASPIDLEPTGLTGRFLEVIVDLRGARTPGPTLDEIGVTVHCGR